MAYCFATFLIEGMYKYFVIRLVLAKFYGAEDTKLGKIFLYSEHMSEGVSMWSQRTPSDVHHIGEVEPIILCVVNVISGLRLRCFQGPTRPCSKHLEVSSKFTLLQWNSLECFTWELPREILFIAFHDGKMLPTISAWFLRGWALGFRRCSNCRVLYERLSHIQRLEWRERNRTKDVSSNDYNQLIIDNNDKIWKVDLEFLICSKFSPV